MENRNRNIDVNTPVTNPVLKDLLVQKNNIQDETSQEYYDCMNKILEEIAINSYLLVVVKTNRKSKNEDVDGKVVFEEGDTITFELLPVDGNNNNKYIYMPLFTDWESLYIWKDKNKEKLEAWILNFDDCCAWLDQGMMDGIVINPYSDTLFITKDQMKHMREEKEARTTGKLIIREQEEIIIGDPINYPHALVAEISNYAKLKNNINAVYLKYMERKGIPSYLLIIDSKDNYDSICSDINKFSKLIPKDMVLYSVPFDSSWKKSLENDKPFYKKKKYLFW